jgi:phosphoribosyl-ATP pyrophosphohydrolase
MNQKKLYKIIRDRIVNPSKGSYINSLVLKGEDKIIQKVGEEATEVVIAAKNVTEKRIIEEMADLWFHSLVLLASKKINPKKVWQELEKRHRQKTG